MSPWPSLFEWDLLQWMHKKMRHMSHLRSYDTESFASRLAKK